MKGFVAITDGDWFRFLRSLPDVDEVNFWQPSGSRRFKALEPLEPMLFKLHHPQNFIVGGGFFAQFSILPCSMAWDAFDRKNGAATLDQMRERVFRYRRVAPEPYEDPLIGCIILRDPFFFDEPDWIPVPDDFAKNIVQGKTYDLAVGSGAQLWAQVTERLGRLAAGMRDQPEGEVYGRHALVRQRLGQGTFRVVITETYDRHCAVTGERALPVLEAAHIKAISEGGGHRVDNGILLRSDVHTLFDRGYLTITPEYVVRASPRLHVDFNDGKNYRALDGQQIWLPRGTDERPRREFLEWHADTVFRR